MPDEHGRDFLATATDEIIVVFDNDPSLEDQEVAKIEEIIDVSRPLLGAGIMRPVRALGVHIFPESQIPRANESLKRLGFSAAFNGKALAVAARDHKDDTHAEIFVLCQEGKFSSKAHHRLGHELIHLLEGAWIDPQVTGEVWDLVKKPLGDSAEDFEALKVLIEATGQKPAGYQHKGLVTYVKGQAAEGKAYYWPVFGESLNELAIDALASAIFSTGGESLLARRFADRVGIEELFVAYVSGQTDDLAQIFEQKTEVPLATFSGLIDQLFDILESKSSKNRLQEAKETRDQALSLLG